VNANARAKIFFSYSHRDEELRDRLATHLSVMKREGVVEQWHDRRIQAGDEWRSAIDSAMEEADLILLLVSPDFCASDYCWDVEVKRALERYGEGSASVIPVILRPTDWQSAPFAKLKPLPKDGKAITTWQNPDEAFLDVVLAVRGASAVFQAATKTHDGAA
jgi:hypothetical protein